MKRIGEIRTDFIRSKETGERNKHVHVTDLSACPIGVWLQKTGQAVPEFNDSKLRRFDAGKNIEERVIEASKAAGLLHSSQGLLEWPEQNMVGSYDLILKEGEEMTLVEVKSIHTFGMDYLYKENKPHDHYLAQIMLYWSKLKETYPQIKAKIYYEALDGRTAEFDIVFDPKLVERELAKASELNKCVKEMRRPTAIENYINEDGKWAVNWRIKYCFENGTHVKCLELPEDTDVKKLINKMTYQAKKMNAE